MKNAKLAVLAVLIIFITSCATREQKCKKWGYCGQNSTITEYRETVRTDTIIQDDSQVWIDMLLECDSTGEVYIDRIDRLETDNTDLKFKLNNNRVYVYMDVPADTVKVKGKDTVRIEKVNSVVEVNVLKRWQKILMWLGLAFIVFAVIFIYIMIKSFIKGRKSM